MSDCAKDAGTCQDLRQADDERAMGSFEAFPIIAVSREREITCSRIQQSANIRGIVAGLGRIHG